MAQPLGKMIVMAAFDEDEEGNLIPAFNPREFTDAARAKREANQLSAEVQRRAMQLATILEPLLIVSMGFVVMLIVLAVLLPIIQLNTWVK